MFVLQWNGCCHRIQTYDIYSGLYLFPKFFSANIKFRHIFGSEKHSFFVEKKMYDGQATDNPNPALIVRPKISQNLFGKSAQLVTKFGILLKKGCIGRPQSVGAVAELS